MFPEGVTSNGKSVLPFEIDDKRLKQFVLGEDFTSTRKKKKSSTTTAATLIRDEIGSYKGKGNNGDGNDIRNVIQWCQIKHIPSTLTVPVPESGFEFFKRLLYVNRPQSKCKIIPSAVAVGYDSSTASITAHGRVTLNGGQTPVARTLNAAQKAQFIAEWGRRM